MPDLQSLNALDYVVVAIYMAVVLGVGVYLGKFNQRTDDYFKGGGHVPWGMSGLSLFISGFSAFMFVGAAGFTYRNGAAALLLFPLAGVCYVLGYFVYGRLWRRSRIDTPMEFLTRRYSASTTYAYTLLSVVPNVLLLGVYIYTLCIFVAAALGFTGNTYDLGFVTLGGFQLAIVLTGVVMVTYTALGGLWAVLVTDTIQVLMLVLISFIVLPVAYATLGGGNPVEGVGRLIREAPEGFFSLSIDGESWTFYVAYFVNIVLGYNVAWHIGQRYYSVADERDTKKMAALCAGFGVAFPLLWVVPVMATVVMFPDIASMWPDLTEPSEAAFVSLALATLPHGMLGVMVAAIFAATMSSADTTFNWLGAVLTKDVFVPVSERVNGRTPSERVQLLVGKGTVLTIGLLAIAVALAVEKYGGAFDVYLKLNSLYNAPMFVPVLLGLVWTRTPWWSGLASFLAGTAAVVATSYAVNVSQGLPTGSFDLLFQDARVTLAGVEMGRYELNTFSGFTVASAVFGLTALLGRGEGAAADRIAALARDLATPAYAAPGTAVNLRGLEAYQIAGRVGIGIGVVLVVAAVVAGTDRAWLNVAAAALALAFGLAIEWGVRRARARLAAPALGGPPGDGLPDHPVFPDPTPSERAR